LSKEQGPRVLHTPISDLPEIDAYGRKSGKAFFLWSRLLTNEVKNECGDFWTNDAFSKS
jgi:hypothetical protein